MSILSLALPVILTINNYVIKIENNTLKTVETTGVFSSELNLSSLGLRNVDNNAFAAVSNLRSLDLANNSLLSLPEFVFGNLTNLKILSLANNNISRFDNVFNGLRTLKSLNITNNPQQQCWENPIFVGLNANCDIWTRGTFPRCLMASAFDYYPRRSTFSSEKSESLIRQYQIESEYSIWNLEEEYQVCIPNGVVQTLRVAPPISVMNPGCFCVKIGNSNSARKAFNLTHLGIVQFETFWYRVQSLSIGSINLSWNNVSRVSSELLNDLPMPIANVSLACNKIERLEKGVINNQWIKLLDFSNNFISAIEDDALRETNISALILNGNRLKDIEFAITLPSSIVTLNLHRNEINEIADRSFRKIGNLAYLDLGENSIMELRSLSLSGLTRLKKLVLHENRLRRIEPGAFHDLTYLTDLDLCFNSIAIIEKGVFLGLTNIQTINLTGNKLTRIGKDFLFGISNSLNQLYLNFNAIEVVEAGSFVKGPRQLLSIGNNRISKIEKGTFGVPKFRFPMFWGKWVANEEITRLAQSYSPTEIKSGLRALSILNNKIERLENGALFGMEKSARTEINCWGVNIELIQPGLFDDLSENGYMTLGEMERWASVNRGNWAGRKRKETRMRLGNRKTHD